MAFDLHCHTVFSDGSTDIKSLLYAAKRAELTGIAITDHDTFEGYYKALKLNKEYKLNLIKGIEISTIDKSRGKKAHILCYNPKETGVLNDIISEITKKRFEAMRESIRILETKYPISFEMVMKNKKEAIGFDRHMKDSEIIRRMSKYLKLLTRLQRN